MELALATKYAEKIVAWLKPHCVKLEVAGSIRRRRPHVNDIDIICIPNTTEYKDLLGTVTGVQNHCWMFLINYINNYDRTMAVAGGTDPKFEKPRLISGDQPTCKQMQIQLPKCQLDLWFASADNFATRLLMRTGSKEHNIWLADRATARGMHWKPYEGLTADTSSRPDGIIDCATEADLYGRLGLEFIEPENRERDWIAKNIESGL